MGCAVATSRCSPGPLARPLKSSNISSRIDIKRKQCAHAPPLRKSVQRRLASRDPRSQVGQRPPKTCFARPTPDDRHSSTHSSTSFAALFACPVFGSLAHCVGLPVCFLCCHPKKILLCYAPYAALPHAQLMRASLASTLCLVIPSLPVIFRTPLLFAI